MKITSTRKRKPLADGPMGCGWSGSGADDQRFTLGIWRPTDDGRNELHTVTLTREEAARAVAHWSEHLV